MIFIRNGRLVEAEASGSMVRHGIRYFLYDGEPFTWAVGAFEDRAHLSRTLAKLGTRHRAHIRPGMWAVLPSSVRQVEAVAGSRWWDTQGAELKVSVIVAVCGTEEQAQKVATTLENYRLAQIEAKRQLKKEIFS